MQAELVVYSIRDVHGQSAWEILLHKLFHERAQFEGPDLDHDFVVFEVDHARRQTAIRRDWLVVRLLIAEPKSSQVWTAAAQVHGRVQALQLNHLR